MQDRLWVNGGGEGGWVGKLVNEVERGGGWGMFITFVDALTCTMGLIA